MLSDFRNVTVFSLLIGIFEAILYYVTSCKR